MPKANFAKPVLTRSSLDLHPAGAGQGGYEPNLIMKWSATPRLLATACVNTEARRAWLAFATSPRQHGAVTFENFLPASRGWQPLPMRAHYSGNRRR
ncbi:hypothetical protein ACVXHB_06885 [Escherichia coli]